MTKLAVALIFLGLNFYTYYFLANEAIVPPRTLFAEFPLEPGDGWACLDPETIEEDVQENLGVTDYLLCNFKNQQRDEIVNVYVGYHESQVREEGGGSYESSIHPPAHCLPGSGWDIVQSSSIPLGFEGPHREDKIRRLLIAKGSARQLVYYWYHSRGRLVAEDWQKVVYVGLDRALEGRTDGSLVRFSIPVSERRGGVDKAEATFQSLAPLIVSRLPAYVPE
jgi:EpsI family protein